MNQPEQPTPAEESDLFGNVRWVRLVLTVVILMVAVSQLTQYYSTKVLLPRYCESQFETLLTLEKILTRTRPSGEEARKPYIIAAKLIFLVPQKTQESTEDYLRRVENYLRSQCS